MMDLRFIKALWSPFKPFKLKWYCGKIAMGTPYFYPRKWVRMTKKMAHEEAVRELDKWKAPSKYKPTYEALYERNLRSKIAVPKKFGFNFWNLGWKTKWRSTDIRFEYAPGLSFVFFKWQIVVSVSAYEQDHYWECWIYYEYYTDKTKSKRERIEECIKDFPCVWTNKYGKINYYELILRKKWIKTSQQYNG